MSRATDYLEQLGSDRRVVEPSVVDAIIGLGMVLDERLGQIHNVMIRMQMTGEELLAEARHARAALAPADSSRGAVHDPEICGCGDDASWCPRNPARLEDQEPDIDDEPPPDYGPPGSGAVTVEYGY